MGSWRGPVERLTCHCSLICRRIDPARPHLHDLQEAHRPREDQHLVAQRTPRSTQRPGQHLANDFELAAQLDAGENGCLGSGVAAAQLVEDSVLRRNDVTAVARERAGFGWQAKRGGSQAALLGHGQAPRSSSGTNGACPCWRRRACTGAATRRRSSNCSTCACTGSRAGC